MIIKNSDAVCGDDDAAFKNFDKDTLSGHDAVSYLFIYGTAIVTFLADLGDLDQCVFSQFQAGAHRQFPEFDAFGGNIFGKIARIDVKAFFPDLGNTLNSQKTDLAMPITGMGVIFQTVVFHQFARVYVGLFNALFQANRYSDNPAVISLLKVGHFIFSTIWIEFLISPKIFMQYPD
jgi:hypothetical protein